MRRDTFTLDTALDGSDERDRPLIEITADSTANALDERLVRPTGEPIDADGIDVALRLQGPPDADDTTGVFGITNSVTGEYVLEVNTDADSVLRVIEAARDDQGGIRGFTVRIVPPEGDPITVEKSMLLVYDPVGNLLRTRSLIPNGVEL